MNNIMLCLLCLTVAFGARAQSGREVQTDFGEGIKTRDVVWSARELRLDPHDKGNEPLMFDADMPGKGLAEIIIQAIKDDRLKAYAAADTGYTEPLRATSFAYSTATFGAMVHSYRLVEYWHFDSTQNKLVTEIISLSPERMVNGKLPEMFTVRYADLKGILADSPIADDPKQRTWLNYFEGRQYAGIR